MRHSMQRSAYVPVAALAVVLLSSSPSVAAEANFYLNSTGSNTVLAGVYTSPYTAQITPGSLTNSSSSATVNAICDDFFDQSFVPEDWNTNVTTLSSLAKGTSSQVYYGGASGNWTVSDPTLAPTLLSQYQAYEVAALLAIDIDFNSAAGSIAQQDYSYALWQLFDPNTSNEPDATGLGAIGWLQTYTGVDSNSNAQKTAVGVVETDLNQAVLAVTDGAASTILSNYNVTIYSYNASLGVPTPPSSCGEICPQPQEFITVSMAEPPSAAVFAVYFLLGGGSLLFFGSRRILKDR
jgi:hypothetical protein